MLGLNSLSYRRLSFLRILFGYASSFMKITVVEDIDFFKGYNGLVLKPAKTMQTTKFYVRYQKFKFL